MKVLFPLFAGLWKMEEQKKAVAVVVVGRAKNWLLKADYNWPFEVRRSFFGMRVLTHMNIPIPYIHSKEEVSFSSFQKGHIYIFFTLFKGMGEAKKSVAS